MTKGVPKVHNMFSRTGKGVPNQFIIEHTESISGNKYFTFQSYTTVIAQREICYEAGKIVSNTVYLDESSWDYSVTTGKYRNQFLGETKAETQKKINSGEYQLTNLNA